MKKIMHSYLSAELTSGIISKLTLDLLRNGDKLSVIEMGNMMKTLNVPRSSFSLSPPYIPCCKGLCAAFRKVWMACQQDVFRSWIHSGNSSFVQPCLTCTRQD